PRSSGHDRRELRRQRMRKPGAQHAYDTTKLAFELGRRVHEPRSNAAEGPATIGLTDDGA
ncbi:MAG: hypothetical protein ACRDRS_18560, partial [Pseudonocardiaceae bacterium]